MTEHLAISTLADRPELRPLLWEMPDSWPEFMLQDLVAHATLSRLVDEFPEFTLVATDAAGELVARGLSVPFRLATAKRGQLPFDADGEVLVPAALAPVRCDLAGDHAVYVEPNVWLRHRL